MRCLFISGSTQTELCNSTQVRKVLKDENVVYVRDSWGKPEPGAYWLRGNYVWEAYIDDVKIGRRSFTLKI